MDSTVIAIRYALARRQFGAEGKSETQLIEYPLHQYRLITRFAEGIAHLLGANRIFDMWCKNAPRLLEEKNRNTDLCHALSSNLKAFIAWKTQDTLVECRRACGGHGYSHHALFGVKFGINDLNQTWEGDNHVLLMQSQQFLFK